MARSRNLKPGFFKNEILAEIEPLGRLLFAGLWTLADREGKLEDRPKRIKAEILPYDDCNPDELLTVLCERGFIIRYIANNSCKYIAIPKEAWGRHQSPHPKEPSCNIPDPDKSLTSHLQKTDKSLASPSYSSSYLDPSNPKDIHVSPKTPECPHEKIVALYHEILPELPEVREWNEDRKKKLRARWKSKNERQDIEWWRDYFLLVKKSNFLTGKVTDFRATLEWLVSPKNFIKVIEGNYSENRAGNTPGENEGYGNGRVDLDD